MNLEKEGNKETSERELAKKKKKPVPLMDI